MRSGAGRLAVVLTVVVAVFFGLRIVSGKSDRGFGAGDLFQLYLPTYEAAAARLARGELFLWNPYQLCGVPTHATLQGGFLYPPHVLYLVLPAPTALAVST